MRSLASLDPCRAVEEVVHDHAYPCLGARSVVNRDRLMLGHFGQLGDPAAAPVLLDWLRDAVVAHDPSDGFVSFVAVFEGPLDVDEHGFERLLWRQLQMLHDVDPSPWSAGVSADPEDERFAFSAGGTAYFVIGLHPHASRRARRMPYPALVFNLHAQFDELRRTGKYDRLRDAIRSRDRLFAGSVNRMAADHGASSEACQYAGRAVEPGWIAPFVARDAA
jgi:hypothetical protein